MTISDRIDVHGGILVGHDGSPEADAALRTAIRCVPSLGSRIHVVRCWVLSTAPALGPREPGHIPSYEDFEQSVLSALESDIDRVREDNRQIAISASVVHGRAAQKLIEASGCVDMIVLGSRGRGGFAALLVGSVSDQVVHHSTCRVLLDRGASLDPAEFEPASRDQMKRALLSELKLNEPE